MIIGKEWFGFSGSELPGLPGTGITNVNAVTDNVDTGFFNPAAFFEKYNKEAAEAAREQRIWAAEQAAKQMEFQERMANTQYQRAAEDMRAAGLNPYLLMSGRAHQAAAPAGAMATTSVADVYKKNDMLERDIAILGAVIGIINAATSMFKIPIDLYSKK